MTVSLRWLVSGRVQGVGFRWFTWREANRLGAAGWVRNLRDGRVEVVARGSADALEALEKVLQQGPDWSRVEKVEKLEAPDDVDEYKSFEII